MSTYVKGQDALAGLMEDNSTGSDNEFTPFNSGSTYNVKVLGKADLVKFYSYGVYKKTYSFVAKNGSTKDEYGNPVENLTCWDRAWKHYKDQSKKYRDKMDQEAYKYKPKERYMMGFYDIDTGELIVIDASKQQARTIYGTIKKNINKLDDLVFTLSKQGKSTNTEVSLDVMANVSNNKKMEAAGIDVSDDEKLTDVQQKNFDNAPEEFDEERFQGVLFEASDDQMIINLDKAGFDVGILGLEVPEVEEGEEGSDEVGDDLPF